MPEPTVHAPPSLAELMGRFLAARRNGLPADDAEGEVEPHEVTGGFRAAAAVTWGEAKAALRLFGVEAEKLPPPPDWAAFASLVAPAAAVPLAAGLFPQRVREIPATPPKAAAAEQVPGFAALRGWVLKALKSKSPTALLLAAGVAAGLGDEAEADAALAAAEPLCTGAWRPAWENQRAAVLWLRGRHHEAAEAWAGPDAAAAFNRGMAALFTGRPGDAAGPLRDAAGRLPDSSGWSHLAKLYLSLAGG